MRVVLDTNILARAAHNPTGPAGEALEFLGKPEHVLILSSFILDELDRVLRYPRLRQLHGLDETEIEKYVQSLADAALVVQITTAAGTVAADPDDDPIVATAEAGKADVLCTLDRHLHRPDVVDYCRHQAVDVLTDVELLQRLRQ